MPVVAQSLAEQAYTHLRDRIVLLEVRPGDPLDDIAIAEALGVGRTPVREALKRLEVDRLVVAYPRRGTFATGVDITDLAHISEIRQALEPVAAARAARNATSADRARLTELAAVLAELAGRGDVPESDGPDPAGSSGRAAGAEGGLPAGHAERAELLRRDLEVHRALYRATGNPHLEDVLVRQDNHATRIWGLFLDRLPGLAGHVGEHAELIAAVVAADEDKAARLAAEHVAHFEEAIRAVM